MRLHSFFFIALLCHVSAAGLAMANPAGGGEIESSFKAHQCDRAENTELPNPHFWVTNQGDCLPGNLTSLQSDFLRTALYPPVDNRLIALDGSEVDAILAEIIEPRDRSILAQWWDNLLNWLKGFETQKNGDGFEWFLEFLKAVIPSAETAQVMLYAVLAITILSAVALVVYEVYISGWLSRIGNRFGSKKAINDEPVFTEKASEVRVDLEGLPPARQVALMLRQCIEILSVRHELSGNRSLTNHELCRFLQQQQAVSAAAFSSLAELSEPVLYGGETPSQQTLLLCRQQCQHILDS